ncbi:MAG: hypothetical protein QW514_00055 [Thermoprotei archaeon]
MVEVSERPQQQTSMMGRLFQKISSWLARIFRGIRRLFSPEKANLQKAALTLSDHPTQSASTQQDQSKNVVSTVAPPAPSASVESSVRDTADKSSEPQMLLGSLQTMIATPTPPVEVINKEKVEQENEENGEEYVIKIKPKPSPPLPKEHRDVVRKLVRAGKRKEAAQQLEEFGYLFPEVATRGKYIIVKYRGRDGYLYAARIRYKS